MKLKSNIEKLVKTTEKVSPAPKKKYIPSPNLNESNSISGSNPRK
jgi:hypothetical protein